MAKNPIKQIQVDNTAYDVQDNTLVAGEGITITESTETGHEGERIISASGGGDVTASDVSYNPGTSTKFNQTNLQTLGRALVDSITIEAQYIRIWSLTPGTYSLVNTNKKYLYYKGATDTTTHTVVGDSGTVVLTVSQYSSTTKHWWYINGTSSHASIYHGYTTSSTGVVGTEKSINDLLTGISSSDVTGALGYTPYNSTNPNGYTSNTGTVTSVAVSNDTNGGLTVSSGSPITTSGTIKLKHSNILSATGTIGSSSATSGATLAVPYANYDINGHITSKGTHTHTINNLTSSAINSSYKLPTTTEWDAKSSVSANPSTTTGTLTGLTIDGTNYKVGGFAYPVAYCTSSSSSTTKTATLPGFQLVSGAAIMIVFTQYNTASSFTLNVNSTGAKNASGPYPLNKMRSGLYYAYYNGSSWNLTYVHNVSSHQYHHILDVTINNTTTSSKPLRLRIHYWTYELTEVTSSNVSSAGFGFITSAVAGGRYILDGASYYAYATTGLCPIVKLEEREDYDEDTGETTYYLDVSYTRSTATSTFTFADGFGSGVTLNQHLILD